MSPKSSSKSVPKTVSSAWTLGLAALLIIQIFAKIVEASYISNIQQIVTISLIALAFALAIAGVLMSKKWGIAIAVIVSIVDLMVHSYVGGSIAFLSAIMCVGVFGASYFVYKCTFEK